ncbi:MAG: class I SAM-dependent methyltransferase [Verrucomicrobiota bacterium]
MKRIPEPETMDGEEQAWAYAEADFEEPHSRVLGYFDRVFDEPPLTGPVLDIGCGPGDITFRFARAWPEARFVAVDASAAMLKPALLRRAEAPESFGNIDFREAWFPGPDIPDEDYSAIISSSFLHHVHDPIAFWQGVYDLARPGAFVFVVDLFRPESEQTARDMVETYVKDEPEVLRHDFYHSLLAAFEPDEVREHLRRTGLGNLTVETVTDRHLIIYGRKSDGRSEEQETDPS